MESAVSPRASVVSTLGDLMASFYQEDDDLKFKCSEDSDWYLVDRCGRKQQLKKRAMLCIGHEDADLVLKSRSVDAQHALLNYESVTEKFRIKDLSSVNGTFVNESRIPEDMYVYLEHKDSLRFGYDSSVYRIFSSALKTPGTPEGDLSTKRKSAELLSPEDASPLANEILNWTQQSLMLELEEFENLELQSEQEVHEGGGGGEGAGGAKLQTSDESPRRHMRRNRSFSPDSLSISRDVENTQESRPRRKSVKELYGQPSWWGEENTEEDKKTLFADSLDADVIAKPHRKEKVMKTPVSEQLGDSLEPQQQQQQQQRPTSLDLTDSLDTLEQVTPIATPVAKQRPAEAFTISLEVENEGEEEEEKVLEKEAKPSINPTDVDQNGNTDVDDDLIILMNSVGDSGGKDMAPLSRFMPSKIRKSFNERKEMQARKVQEIRERSRKTISDSKVENSDTKPRVSTAPAKSSSSNGGSPHANSSTAGTPRRGAKAPQPVPRQSKQPPKAVDSRSSSRSTMRHSSSVASSEADETERPRRGSVTAPARSIDKQKAAWQSLQAIAASRGKPSTGRAGVTKPATSSPRPVPVKNPRGPGPVTASLPTTPSGRTKPPAASRTSRTAVSNVSASAVEVEENVRAYPDTKSYLFERMFTNSSNSVSSGRNRNADNSAIDVSAAAAKLETPELRPDDDDDEDGPQSQSQPPEYDLYSEARNFDKPPSINGGAAPVISQHQEVEVEEEAPSEAGTYTISDGEDEDAEFVQDGEAERVVHEQLLDEAVSNLHHQELELKTGTNSSPVSADSNKWMADAAHHGGPPSPQHQQLQQPHRPIPQRAQPSTGYGSAQHLHQISDGYMTVSGVEGVKLRREFQMGVSRQAANRASMHAVHSQPQTPGRSGLPPPGELHRKASDSMLSDVLSSHRSGVSDVMSSPRMTASYHSQHQPPPPAADTSFLLQDTESVLKDLEARVAAKKHEHIPYADDEIGSDSDEDSGGGELEGYSYGARQTAGQRGKLVFNVLSSARSTGSIGPPDGSGKRVSVSTSEADDVQSLDSFDGGSIRGNKTYALRRALNSAKDDNPTSGSVKSSARSGVSLGTKIAVRSKENAAAVAADNIQRHDYGRHSLKFGGKLQQPTISTAGQSGAAVVTTSTTSSSNRRSLVLSNHHAVSKSDASVAWQRRKDYDPRKSVAEAKARAAAASGAATCNTNKENACSPPSASSPESAAPHDDGSGGGRLRRDNYNNSSSTEELSFVVNEHRDRGILEREASDAQIAKMSSELRKDLEILAQSEDLAPLSGRKSAFSPLHSPDSPGGLGVASFRSKSAAVLNEDPRRTSPHSDAYDSLMLSSILQLSRKLRRCSEDILLKLRRSRHLSRTPSPIEDVFTPTDATNGGMGSTASLHRSNSRHNAELVDSLRNLKAVEYQLQCAERALFPQAKSGRSSAIGSCSEDDYLAELERINHELRGFTPIDRSSAPGAGVLWNGQMQQAPTDYY